MRLYHLLIFAALVFMILIVVHSSQEIFLFYYLLSPLWLFPIFYFLTKRDYFFLGLGGLAVLGVHGWFLAKNPLLRIGLMWGIQVFLFFALYYYYRELQICFRKACAEKEEVCQSLGSLNRKFDMRQSSLKHLEVQVSSLLSLFEIARDFSECMDFNTLADFLMKKLCPELGCEKMQIFLIQKPGSDQGALRIKVFEMVPGQVTESERELSEDEKNDFERMEKTKALVRHNDGWFFPILENNVLSSVFSIHGIKEDDLASVEVLSAYLVLLIKKIKLYATVRELAIMDELTQVFVRHHFVERLEEELKRSIRFKLPLAVLMLDIDHFKRYNDEFGHLVGDATLREVADLLKKNLRRVDLVGRYGGEEFLVAMPEARLVNAAEVAERIRSNIARHDFQVYNDKTKVTVSQGLTMFDGEAIKDPETADAKAIALDLIRQADEAMYKAKQEGRNRVCLCKDIKRS